MSPDWIDALAWDSAIDRREGGLLPAIVQDADTRQVLMLGYISRLALQTTIGSGRVTFFSRSKGRMWTKGESSGHALMLASAHTDCDRDAVLLLARPLGPTCHLGMRSCFSDVPPGALFALEEAIEQRARDRPDGSYTVRLLDAGVRGIAQKLGEEGVETALAAVVEDDTALLAESADLVYHLLVLLRARGLRLADVERVLQARRV